MENSAKAKRALGLAQKRVRQASQALAEFNDLTGDSPGQQREPAQVLHQIRIEDGRTPADLSSKVANAAHEHGAVDVLVIANQTTASQDEAKE